MTNEQIALAVAAGLIILFAGLVFQNVRGKRFKDPEPRSTEIATIVEREPKRDGALAAGGLMLICSTIYCLFRYFAAETIDQQIVALLLWIGNGIFWGALIISNAVLIARTSTVLRTDQPPTPEHRVEPRL